MVTRKQSLENFNTKMAELINSKVLLADGKITNVLVSITDSALLYQTFEYVLEGVNVQALKEACFKKDGDGKGYFVLPETDAEILAIGFIVLMEIDKKHTDLLTFVNEWFSVLDNNQRSFNFFAESFLIPFQSTTQKVAYMLINEQNYQDEVIEEGRKHALAKQDETSDSGEKSLYQNAEKYLDSLILDCQKESEKDKKREEDYDELIFVLTQTKEAIKNADTNGISHCFVSLKYMQKYFKKIRIDLEELASLISEILL